MQAPSSAPGEVRARCSLGSSSEAEAMREFYQRRLALYGKTIFLLCFAFYVLANLLLFLEPGHTWWSWVSTRDNQACLAACAVLGAVWLLSARGTVCCGPLLAIDAAGTFLSVACYALISLYQVSGRSEYVCLLGVTNTLVARAILVPSTAGRTFWIGLVTSVPALAAAMVIYRRPGVTANLVVSPPFLSLIVVLWCIVAIVISTVASRIIYGLRREVTEARRLGQYTLEEKIGAGGMGEVYKASHALLRRPTAVKLLRGDAAGEANMARFEREVQLTSRLTHPNTIAIYDYGRTPDGVFYYAMEYLPGITLDDLVKLYGPQPAGRVIHILRQVCASLSEAHGIGFIHRDIKGPNVILCERGGQHDVVKVVDFGLVKDLEAMNSVTLSGADTITGTPHFLSPEAIRAPGTVDARSDLYSVGVLGYYLLAGKHPFESQSVVEVLTDHLHTPPVPPSARLAASIPRDVEAAVMKCLEKQPGLRPESALLLAAELEACADARSWSEEEARTWWREHEARRRSAPSDGVLVSPMASSSARLAAQPTVATERP